MPHIMVLADRSGHNQEAPVMLRERLTPTDLESRHFADRLVERLGWAVEDAHEAEQQAGEHMPPSTEQHPGAELQLGAAGRAG